MVPKLSQNLVLYGERPPKEERRSDCHMLGHMLGHCSQWRLMTIWLSYLWPGAGAGPGPRRGLLC